MTWVNLNIVQYMIIIHTIDEMKEIIYNDSKRRHEVLKSVICIIDEESKLSFSISIVEYNHYMRDSNKNAQQRSYYSCQRSNSRYWWSLFTFLLNVTVLNTFKLWDRLYLLSKFTHSEFQKQIAQMLLKNETSRKHKSIISIITSETTVKSSSCEWEHNSKKSYRRPCREKEIKLRKRRLLEKINENPIKKRRIPQIRWQCKSCEPRSKQRSCGQALHSCSD
jgi:hypothetical protein